MRKISVLAIFANPKGTDPLRLAEEDRVLHECIQLSKYRNNVDLIIKHAATIHDLRRALLEKQYRIVHFSGHGTGQGLAFENESGEALLVPPLALAELFSTYSPPVESVLLNACFSEGQGQLISLGVPYTIAMSEAISDKSAIEFSRGFYDAIGAGKNLEFAYEEGCRTINLAGLSGGSAPILLKGTKLSNSDIHSKKRVRKPRKQTSPKPAFSELERLSPMTVSNESRLPKITSNETTTNANSSQVSPNINVQVSVNNPHVEKSNNSTQNDSYRGIEPSSQNAEYIMKVETQATPNATKSPEPATEEFFKLLDEEIRKAQREKFTFLLVGRTGVGKTSTVRSLLGREVGKVGKYEPTTMTVDSYEDELYGIKFTVVDTPGLCDELEEIGNDEKYIRLIHDKIKEFDCMWFVTRLDDTRVSSDEKRGIKVISQAFGSKVWEHSIIVFTFSNMISDPKAYAEAVEIRGKLIRKEVARWTDEKTAENIPTVPVDNTNVITPDKKKWLGELYTAVFHRIKDRGVLPFLVATIQNVRVSGGSSDYWRGASTPNSSSHSTQYNQRSPDASTPSRSTIDLSPSNTRAIESRVTSVVSRSAGAALGGAAAGAITGAAVGSALGPVGAAVGAGIGAVAGAIIGYIGSRTSKK